MQTVAGTWWLAMSLSRQSWMPVGVNGIHGTTGGVLEVLVYAPRDEAEMRVVQKLVLASIEYASNTPLNAVA